LRQFNFIYHCYFIIGNIGETKDEMLDIVNFSHELSVDTLGLSDSKSYQVLSPQRHAEGA